jgi:hypothetical protein
MLGRLASGTSTNQCLSKWPISRTNASKLGTSKAGSSLSCLLGGRARESSWRETSGDRLSGLVPGCVERRDGSGDGVAAGRRLQVAGSAPVGRFAQRLCPRRRARASAALRARWRPPRCPPTRWSCRTSCGPTGSAGRGPAPPARALASSARALVLGARVPPDRDCRAGYAIVPSRSGPSIHLPLGPKGSRVCPNGHTSPRRGVACRLAASQPSSACRCARRGEPGRRVSPPAAAPVAQSERPPAAPRQARPPTGARGDAGGDDPLGSR